MSNSDKDKNESVPSKVEQSELTTILHDTKVEQRTLASVLHDVSVLIHKIQINTSKFATKTVDAFETMAQITEKVTNYPIKQKYNKEMLQLSNKVNKDYDYFSMLCRTHGDLIKATVTTTIAVPSLRLGRKLFLFNTISAYLLASTAVYIVQYKWINDGNNTNSSNNNKH